MSVSPGVLVQVDALGVLRDVLEQLRDERGHREVGEALKGKSKK